MCHVFHAKERGPWWWMPHWGPTVTPGVFPQFRGSCSSWVQPMMCVKSTKTGICIGILLLWIKDRRSLANQIFLHFINPDQRLYRSYLLSHLLCVSDPWGYVTSRAVPLLWGKCSWTGWMELSASWLAESVQQIWVFSRSVWWKNDTVLLKTCLYILWEQPNALHLELLCVQCWSLTLSFFLNREKGEKKDWESYSFL